MTDALRITIETVTGASVLIMLVSGLAVIVGMMGVLNFAHGDMVLLGAVVMYLTTSWGAPFPVGLLAAFAALFATGVMFERTVVRRLYARPAFSLLATWALGITISQAVSYAFEGTPRNVSPPLAGVHDVHGTAISDWQLLIIGMSLLVMVGLSALLYFTSIGLKVRATLDNAGLAQSCGVRSSRLYAVTFGVGAGLAGLAGALIVPTVTLVPDLGVNFLVESFLGVMAGGAGSLAAPLGGAAIVQTGDSLLSQVISPVPTELVLFLVVLVVVRVRPQGLFGRATL
jgi:branched-chain amino acid transport system permease protein